MKAHEKIVDKRPNICGLILHYMSPESKVEVAQDMDYDVWSKAMDPEKLWQAMLKLTRLIV
jgi:hypothetical protein